MGWLDVFRSKTPAEQLRDNKRLIDRAIRDLDRERMHLEQQEKKTIAEMKKMARLGQQETCRMMAKDVVRTRSYITNCYKMRAQMSSTMKSQQAMAQAMNNVTRTMRIMSRQMNLPAMQKIMAEFERQGDIADIKQEMMEEAMEDTMGAENEEVETEALVNQVFDEVGLSFSQQLSPTPVGIATGQAEETAILSDADLRARLESLRKA